MSKLSRKGQYSSNGQAYRFSPLRLERSHMDMAIHHSPYTSQGWLSHRLSLLAQKNIE